MKFCPNCNFRYADDTLEFCLEDGTRLITGNQTQNQNQTPTVLITNKEKFGTKKTLDMPFFNEIETVEVQGTKNIQATEQAFTLKEESVKQNYKVIEVFTITVALIHNWWQWVYLNNQSYSSFSTYVLSGNFLMWFLLTALGIGVGLYSLKRMPNRIIPITSLVILAINLILFLVPKR